MDGPGELLLGGTSCIMTAPLPLPYIYIYIYPQPEVYPLSTQIISLFKIFNPPKLYMPPNLNYTPYSKMYTPTLL